VWPIEQGRTQPTSPGSLPVCRASRPPHYHSGLEPDHLGQRQPAVRRRQHGLLQQVPNGSGYQPVVGDIVVWDGGAGGYGHVSVVDPTTGLILTVVEQNASPSGLRLVLHLRFGLHRPPAAAGTTKTGFTRTEPYRNGGCLRSMESPRSARQSPLLPAKTLLDRGGPQPAYRLEAHFCRSASE